MSEIQTILTGKLQVVARFFRGCCNGNQIFRSSTKQGLRIVRSFDCGVGSRTLLPFGRQRWGYRTWVYFDGVLRKAIHACVYDSIY